MVTSPNDLKILEWDDKSQANKQTKTMIIMCMYIIVFCVTDTITPRSHHIVLESFQVISLFFQSFHLPISVLFVVTVWNFFICSDYMVFTLCIKGYMQWTPYIVTRVTIFQTRAKDIVNLLFRVEMKYDSMKT